MTESNDVTTVLGVDLASSNWSLNGSAELTFDRRTRAWTSARTRVAQWPHTALSASAMARALDDLAMDSGASVLSLDGPQGWRHPLAGDRPGVGRACEKAARTPGKTGPLGLVYPANYGDWVCFCIDVFAELLAIGNARLFEADASEDGGHRRVGSYWLIECFPSSTWVASGLTKLPGHSAAPPRVVAEHAKALRIAYGLPEGMLTDQHDELQAVVAALPAAAIVGGPCRAVAHGERSALWGEGDQRHRVEGFIWDALPLSLSTQARGAR
jgi:hypothetical protein